MNIVSTRYYHLISMIKRFFNHLGNNLLFFQVKRNTSGGFIAYGIGNKMECMKTKGEQNYGKLCLTW